CQNSHGIRRRARVRCGDWLALINVHAMLRRVGKIACTEPTRGPLGRLRPSFRRAMATRDFAHAERVRDTRLCPPYAFLPDRNPHSCPRIPATALISLRA